MPGVVTVVTGADLLDTVSPLPTNWILPGMPVPVHRVLADEVVRFQGEGIAAVVAADAYTAADAADAIDVDYEPMPAVTDPWQAAQPGAPLVHPGLTGIEDGNIVFRVPMYAGDYAAARERADVVIRQRLRNQNLIPGALEPRSVLAEYDDGAGTVTVHSSTQSPHIIKRMLAEVLSFPEERLRVVAPDVGGGFGSKLHLYPEEVLVTALAIRLRRAVKWTATRSEDFLATNHGRDHVQDVELCATADGVITGIKATLFANLGAYLSDMAAGIPTANCATMVTGVYRIPNVHVDTLGVLTNTSRVDTYRGAGQARGDVPHRAHGRPARAGTAHRPGRHSPPQLHPAGRVSVPVARCSSTTAAITSTTWTRPWASSAMSKLRTEQAELRLHGRYRGIGLATYTEFTGLGSGRLTAAVGFAYGGWEYARVLVHPTGRVSVHVGTADHGQGHATSYAQIAADALGLPAGRHRRRRRGHGAGRIRPGHVQLPIVAGRGKRGPRVLPEGSRQGPPHRRPHAEDGRRGRALRSRRSSAPLKRPDGASAGSVTWDEVARRGSLRPRYPARPRTRAR